MGWGDGVKRATTTVGMWHEVGVWWRETGVCSALSNWPKHAESHGSLLGGLANLRAPSVSPGQDKHCVQDTPPSGDNESVISWWKNKIGREDVNRDQILFSA